MDDAELPEQMYIATGLLRSPTEYIREGVEVFIIAKVADDGISMLHGDPGISVEIGRFNSMRCVTTVPLNAVTVASGYAPADELSYAQARLARLEKQLAAITMVIDDEPDFRAVDAIKRIRDIVYPAPEPEDDE